LQILLSLAESGVALLSRIRGLESVHDLQPGLLVRQQTPLEHQAERLLRRVTAPHRQQDAIIAHLFQQGRDESFPPAATRQQGRELLRKQTGKSGDIVSGFDVSVSPRRTFRTSRRLFRAHPV